MNREVYKYNFNPAIPMGDIEDSLFLAIVGVESLHGESQTHLDARHFLDVERRACVIDASTRAGADLNRLFVGYLRREFGTDHFQVARVDRIPSEPVGAAA